MALSNDVMEVTLDVLDFLAVLFVFSLGCIILAVIIIYVIDRFQSTHTIRRNYPVIGRFRYFFEHMGEFFRQYFFAMDREELPFNRADRSWVYRAAKNIERNIAFGSTRSLTPSGGVIFLNSLFPVLDNKANYRGVSWIGEGFCTEPFKVHSVFNLSGMSYGALSKPAVKALAKGAKDAGIWMNTGEGGVSSYHLKSGCDLVVQIGTAKYGVRDESGALCAAKLQRLAKLKQVKMFEIKLSQGAKPGKGGILPADKVNAEIAAIRGIPEGEASISPNAHPEIRSIADLLDMIDVVRTATGKPVGCKFVLGESGWIDDLCKEILHRGEHSAPDFMTLDSADGGTGAAPQTLMDYVGLPIQESLPVLVDKLSEYGLKKRIKIIASGKLLTPSSVAWALCMGADYIVSARGFMFSLGCIQALQCNKNTCPTGITTHNTKLQRGLNWKLKSKRVVNYVANMQKELEILAHSCGIETPREFKREHAHIIIDARTSKSMAELYPYKQTKEELIKIIE
ncbi:MAG: FMN-binding glutamate synthase family protein [Pseudomonadales bacterium]|nr:FMN-binding glutamate synthase family protein [Pseudomonadales bacterium]